MNSLGGEEVEEKPSEKTPTMSVSQTEGLTSIEQLVDSTSNEVFSFRDGTSEIGKTSMTLPPFHEEQEQNIESAPVVEEEPFAGDSSLANAGFGAIELT